MLDRRSLLKAALGLLGLPLVKLMPPEDAPISLAGVGPRFVAVPPVWSVQPEPVPATTNVGGYYTDARCRAASDQPITGGYFIEEPQ